EVVKIGLELGVPYELTWSCYEGGDEPCGKCGTCIDRAAAFAANGVEDPALKKEK
ncbi:MAG: 7-cyano-7-deazaguanine synthase, partial [Lachnospiraceae bacterium]|nr:7-cyano-7-deazaguanine synthase [Lachnospiraceae bacterium]